MEVTLSSVEQNKFIKFLYYEMHARKHGRNIPSKCNSKIKVIKYSIFPTNICKVQHISFFINQYVSRSDFFVRL